jgi:hypothetical protein
MFLPISGNAFSGQSKNPHRPAVTAEQNCFITQISNTAHKLPRLSSRQCRVSSRGFCLTQIRKRYPSERSIRDSGCSFPIELDLAEERGVTYSLGVDTGGTYTDAVILRGEEEVIASAKALTTRHDLAVGIGEAVRSVLVQAEIDPAEIELASLSTTLATNALVEDQGARVALIAIGFDAKDLEQAGLSAALKDDPVLLLRGGHNHAGSEAAPLDEEALTTFLQDLDPGVTALAVAARFATRNPAHENAAAEKIAEIAGRPVTMSHTLSAKLNGPKRALTALLNARLIGMIDRLIGRAQDALVQLGIHAPLMVVRGDGASDVGSRCPGPADRNNPQRTRGLRGWSTLADRS